MLIEFFHLLLTKFRQVIRNLTNACSATDTMNNLNSSLATAIGSGYFIYLRDFPFKKLMERFGDFENNNDLVIEKKMFIVVPESGPSDVKENDNFKYKDDLESIEDDVAGVEKRKYTQSVYEAKLPFKNEEEAKSHFFAIETAQCLDTLTRMRDHSKITYEDDVETRKQFLQILITLLANDRSFRNRYEIKVKRENESFIDMYKRDSDPLPEMLDLPLNTTNIGVGLAYWFFYNYLHIVLPYFVAGIEEWEMHQNKNIPPGKTPKHMIRRLFILVPSSCYTENFRELSNPGNMALVVNALDPLVKTAGTTKYRQYQKTVIELSDDKNKKKKHYCVAEFATPIRQLYKMHTELSRETGLSKDGMVTEARKFTMELKNLLRSNQQFNRLCNVIWYSDEKDFDFAKFLLKKIKQ